MGSWICCACSWSSALIMPASHSTKKLSSGWLASMNITNTIMLGKTKPIKCMRDQNWSRLFHLGLWISLQSWCWFRGVWRLFWPYTMRSIVLSTLSDLIFTRIWMYPSLQTGQRGLTPDWCLFLVHLKKHWKQNLCVQPSFLQPMKITSWHMSHTFFSSSIFVFQYLS